MDAMFSMTKNDLKIIQEQKEEKPLKPVKEEKVEMEEEEFDIDLDKKPMKVEK